ncbi:MAG: hypothetical protein R3F59_34435, partial [Myxococcota bacterium]
MVGAWVLGVAAPAGATPPLGCPAGVATEETLRPTFSEPVSLVGETFPVRVWHEAHDPAAAALAPAVLAAAELAWQVQVDEIGFRPPVLPDG